MATVNEQDIPTVNLIIYQDDRFIKSINVKNSDGTDYDFTGATATLRVDATRPITGDIDLQYSTSAEITLSSGNIAIDGEHTLTPGTYEYDFTLTVSSKPITLFKGKIEVKENV